jgi:hypothetical protein
VPSRASGAFLAPAADLGVSVMIVVADPQLVAQVFIMATAGCIRLWPRHSACILFPLASSRPMWSGESVYTADNASDAESCATQPSGAAHGLCIDLTAWPPQDLRMSSLLAQVVRPTAMLDRCRQYVGVTLKSVCSSHRQSRLQACGILREDRGRFGPWNHAVAALRALSLLVLRFLAVDAVS